MSYPTGRPSETPEPVGGAGLVSAPGSAFPQPSAVGGHPVPGQRRNQGILLGILIAVVMAVAGLTIFRIVANSTGWNGFTWGLIFAFVPVVPIIALYLWL